MIEKILERLEAEKQRLEYQQDFFSERKNEEVVEEYGLKIFQMERVLKIVQEVAKGYAENSVVKENLTSEKNGGWIPCSERLPKENELILIYAESTARGGSIRCVAELRNGFWFAQIASDTLGLTGIGQFKVIAWMELPAPYQKGE